MISRMLWNTVLLTAAAASLGIGCAIPSDINIRTDGISPPSLNRQLIVPSPDQVVELSSPVTEFSVAAAVTNVDPDETLYYQWFVAYPESAVPQPPVFESQQTVQFYACGFKDLLYPVGSTHTLELFISEEPLGFDTINGRTIPESYIYVSWPIRLASNCPSQSAESVQ